MLLKFYVEFNLSSFIILSLFIFLNLAFEMVKKSRDGRKKILVETLEFLELSVQ